MSSYHDYKNNLTKMGFNASTCPARELQFWANLSTTQRGHVLKMSGYSSVNPYTSWEKLPEKVRLAIRKRMRKQAEINAAFLGLRLVPEELATPIQEAEVSRINQAEKASDKHDLQKIA